MMLLTTLLSKKRKVQSEEERSRMPINFSLLLIESNTKAIWRRNTSHHSLTALSRQRTPLSPQKYSLVPRRASTSTAPSHMHAHSAAAKTLAVSAGEGGGGAVKASRSISADTISAVGKTAAAAAHSSSHIAVRLEVPQSSHSAHQTTHDRLSTSADHLPSSRSAPLVRS